MDTLPPQLYDCLMQMVMERPDKCKHESLNGLYEKCLENFFVNVKNFLQKVRYNPSMLCNIKYTYISTYEHYIIATTSQFLLTCKKDISVDDILYPKINTCVKSQGVTLEYLCCEKIIKNMDPEQTISKHVRDWFIEYGHCYSDPYENIFSTFRDILRKYEYYRFIYGKATFFSYIQHVYNSISHDIYNMDILHNDILLYLKTEIIFCKLVMLFFYKF